MNNKEKITFKRNWSIAGYERIAISNCTYLKALLYKESLKRYYKESIKDLHYRPILTS